MQRPKKVQVKKERKLNMYSELWHASGCVLNAGISEQRGSTWQFLSSILLTAFTFEAYLNHVGPKVFECWDDLERLPPWNKFKLLHERMGVKLSLASGSRPLQTIIQLFKFRDKMAHGKSEYLEINDERDLNDNLDDHLGEKPLSHWECQIKDSGFATRVREDVKTVLEALHDARPDEKAELFAFGGGVHGAQISENEE